MQNIGLLHNMQPSPWCVTRPQWVNSLAPGRFESKFRWSIFKLISVIYDQVIPCEIALWWLLLNLTDDKSTLVQVKAWCCQATSHHLSKCWPRSLLPYAVTRPQWVKLKSYGLPTTYHCYPGVSEWVIKFNSLSWTVDREVHISHVIIAYTLESLSSLT